MQTNAIKQLNVSLLYLKMGELKELCLQLKLPSIGKKLALIERILIFVERGIVQPIPSLPNASKAKRQTNYPLKPDTLILKGSYKNDLATRKFMKTLVGEHFHFTAYGIDWIEDRWFAAKPPTYQEFADYWETERLRRLRKPEAPKKEWAYINFTQNYLVEHPTASKTEILKAWEKERVRHVKIVTEIIRHSEH